MKHLNCSKHDNTQGRHGKTNLNKMIKKNYINVFFFLTCKAYSILKVHFCCFQRLIKSLRDIFP